ncbi:S8 family serine peptidase [Kineosporia babensis]|uniref:S8 family serine peptidase n=1 Tax=Kineosporia babensis TaxID=499548 RepID=A0A9X1NBG7_9ACTN|nr:S8 family serine peptidase [Kineosporia babensis]MCD5309993.1 S8 family serine peptidase [Kineosporia babensis]
MRRSGRRAGATAALLVAVGVLVCGPVATAGASPLPKDDTKSAADSPKKSSSKKAKTKRKKPKPAVITRPSCGANAAPAGTVVREVPWQQLWLSPERLAPLANGSGQTVAVVDTGVSSEHEQLKGKVQPGYDELRGKPGGHADCQSHGTAVAGLIAADKQGSIGLRGIAPEAEIMPIRVTEVLPASSAGALERTDPAKVAKGIRRAAGRGASVIQVSSAFTAPGALCEASAFALKKGIPVVAAVGDLRNSALVQDAATYPAACEGVIGVGSVGPDFLLAGSSAVNEAVDLVAPGDEVVSTARVSGQQSFRGTSLASGVVAGAVALVRQTDPDLKPAEIAKRLTATADPVPAGEQTLGYGAGLVNPYRAVTEQASATEPQPIAGAAARVVDPVADRIEAAQASGRKNAAVLAAAAIAMVLLLGVLAAAVPRGHRRSWRPGRSAPATEKPTGRSADEEPLFTLPEVYRS